MNLFFKINQQGLSPLVTGSEWQQGEVRHSWEAELEGTSWPSSEAPLGWDCRYVVGCRDQWTTWGPPGQDFGPNCPTYPWRLYMVSGILALILVLPSVGRWDLEEVT